MDWACGAAIGTPIGRQSDGRQSEARGWAAVPKLGCRPPVYIDPVPSHCGRYCLLTQLLRHTLDWTQVCIAPVHWAVHHLVSKAEQCHEHSLDVLARKLAGLPAQTELPKHFVQRTAVGYDAVGSLRTDGREVGNVVAPTHDREPSELFHGPAFQWPARKDVVQGDKLSLQLWVEFVDDPFTAENQQVGVFRYHDGYVPDCTQVGELGVGLIGRN